MEANELSISWTVSIIIGHLPTVLKLVQVEGECSCFWRDFTLTSGLKRPGFSIYNLTLRTESRYSRISL